MKRIPRSKVIPPILLAYLAVMSIIGLPEYRAGHYAYYFGVIGGTLVCIVLLYFSLRRRERLQRERENEDANKR